MNGKVKVTKCDVIKINNLFIRIGGKAKKYTES